MSKKFLNFFSLYLAAALLILSFFILFFAIKPAKKAPSSFNSSLIGKFIYDIKSKGARITYDQLKQNSKNKSFVEKHNLAHLFGKSLYQAEGESGISVCDTDLSFGCYHGLFTEAIITQGTSAIKELDSFCNTSGLFTSCQHGIGHGLVEYLGPNKIATALEECRSIQSYLLVGCSSGVFMEYFFPLGNLSYLDFDPTQPFKPCESVDSKFINSCIFELPRFWRKNDPKLQEFMAECSKLTDQKQQQTCFRGIGFASGNQLRPNPTDSTNICNWSPNNQAKLYCLSGATWFYRTVEKSEITERAINDLCKKTINEKECLKLSDLRNEKMI